MNLFPIHKPTLALSITEEAMCLVEIKKSWRTIKLKEIHRVDLPAGAIRLSSAKPNIEDVEAVKEQMRNFNAIPYQTSFYRTQSPRFVCSNKCVRFLNLSK